MTDVLELLMETDNKSQGQKRSIDVKTDDAPLPKLSKLSDDNTQRKDIEENGLMNDEEQRNTAVSTAASTNLNIEAVDHCTTPEISVAGDVKEEETSSLQESSPEKNKISILSVLNIPSFSDSVQANIPVIKNQRFVGTCMSCDSSLAGKNPLMLGCLHIYCSKCILQRQYFRLSSLISVPKAKAQDGKNSLAVHTSYEKLGNVDSIPEEAFESLDNLKNYIADNFDAVGRLVVKCSVCECNTRAKVISENKFVAKINEVDTPEIQELIRNEIEKLCTNCEENSIAVRFCKNCNEHLCEECVSAHRRVKITKEHELEVIKTLENESGTRNSIVRCDKHVNEEIKLYCETCNKLTCRDCQLEFHREHKYMFVSEAAESQAKILETMQSKLSEKKFFLDQTSSTIKTRLNTMLGCRDKANQEIVQFHQHLHEKITAKCQFFLNKIHEITSGRRLKLKNQLFATERLSSAVDHCVKFIDFAIEKQNSLALLDSKQTIFEYVTTVMRQKFTTNPVASSDIVFVPDNNIMKAITMKLGSLLWGEPASNVINLNHMQHPEKQRKPSGQFQQSTPQSSPSLPHATSQYPGGAIHYRSTLNKNGMSVTSSTQQRPMMQSHPGAAMVSPVSAPHTPHSAAKAQGYDLGGTQSSGRYRPKNGTHTIPHPQAVHHQQKRQVPNQQRQFLHQFQQQQQRQLQPQQQPQQQPQPQRIVRHDHQQQVSRQNQIAFQKMNNPQRRFVNILNSTPIRKPSGSGDSTAIPKVQVQSQTSDLKPFVTRGSSVQQHPKETFIVDLNQFKNQSASHRRAAPNVQVLQRTPSYPSQPFISAVPEALGPERGQSSPVVHNISALTTQNQHSLLHLQDAIADNPGSISSADSGFGGGIMKPTESVTNTEWPCQKNTDLSFSPPALFDLTDFVKIDEECGTQGEIKVTNTAEVSTIKEERKEDEFDVEKELYSLAEGRRKEKEFFVKAEQYSPPLACATEEKSLSGVGTENKYDLNTSGRKYDPNEDWCAVCNNGGDLLCCDTCPKVYHYHCHVPEIMSAPPGTWQCMLCRDINKMLEAESKYPKRKRVIGVQGKELKLCEKLTLELYCHSDSIPFHQAVRTSVPDYHRVIKHPMDLSKVKKKLLMANFHHYSTVEEFLEDIQQMFTNCFHFNGEESTLGSIGKKLQTFFIQQVEEKFPEMSGFLEKLLKQQRQFLDNNPWDSETSTEASPAKTSTPNRKSSTDKSKLPYESDTLWQPGQDENDEEEIESIEEVSERSSENDVVEDSVEDEEEGDEDGSDDSTASEGSLKKTKRRVSRFRL